MKASLTKVRKLLRDLQFNPREDVWKFLADVANREYYRLESIRLIQEAGYVTKEQRIKNIRKTMRILTLMLLTEEG